MRPVFGVTARRAAVVLGAVLLTSCAVVATHEEYGAYRRIRLAEDERDRLIALQRYAEHHADGQWIEEVREARAEREGELWARSHSSRAGLEWYLRVYPDGQYVEQARPRLAAKLVRTPSAHAPLASSSTRTRRPTSAR